MKSKKPMGLAQLQIPSDITDESEESNAQSVRKVLMFTLPPGTPRD